MGEREKRRQQRRKERSQRGSTASPPLSQEDKDLQKVTTQMGHIDMERPSKTVMLNQQVIGPATSSKQVP